jgi:hypothetical protein
MAKNIFVGTAMERFDNVSPATQKSHITESLLAAAPVNEQLAHDLFVAGLRDFNKNDEDIW